MFAVSPALVSIVLLLARAVLTVAFVREFLVKAKDVPAFAKADGLAVPVAWFVTIAELAAAVAFATGVLAPWAGLGVVVLMIITTSLHVMAWHSPYWATKGGPEYDILLLTLAALIVVLGPGALSVPGLVGA